MHLRLVRCIVFSILRYRGYVTDWRSCQDAWGSLGPHTPRFSRFLGGDCDNRRHKSFDLCCLLVFCFSFPPRVHVHVQTRSSDAAFQSLVCGSAPARRASSGGCLPRCLLQGRGGAGFAGGCGATAAAERRGLAARTEAQRELMRWVARRRNHRAQGCGWPLWDTSGSPANVVPV